MLGLISTMACLIWTTACTPIEPASTDAPPEESEANNVTEATFPEPCQDPEAHWSHEGETGPENWAGLSQCFALCDAGVEQSPIDLTAGGAEDLPDLVFNYKTVPLNIVNNGHTVQIAHDGQSSLDFGEMTFSLRQLHFHSPSEHTRQGHESPIEMHLVHSSSGGSLVVVGVFVEPGADNPGLASFWDHLPTTPGDAMIIDGAEVNTSALLPESRRSSRYAGSLTTPPCNEDVRWIVLDEAITLSQEKIDAFTAIYSNNRRPVQPLGERQIASGD